MTDAPIGQRFSLIYVERGTPRRDSLRFRRRLHRAFLHEVDSRDEDYGELIARETGAHIPWGGYGHDWEQFFTKCELRDALDSITIISRSLRYANTWIEAVGRIFREENLGYRLDAAGGVHYSVDEEFERNRNSAVSTLQRPRYAAVLDHFERAHEALDAVPPDTRGAVRQTFDALEALVRLMVPNAPRLGAAEIEKDIKPLVLNRYEGPARSFASLMLNGFADWTNAAHQYRHAQGVESPTPPPADLAVACVSSGAAFLRWLAEVDQRLTSGTVGPPK